MKIRAGVQYIKKGLSQKIIHILFAALVKRSRPFVKPPSLFNVCITSIVSHAHVLYLISNLKTFFFYTNLALPLVIVDDGSLTHEDVTLIKTHFPFAKVVQAAVANRYITRKVKKYPYCLRYKNEISPLMWKHNLKLFDALLIPNTKKVIYMDADILFYKKPTELVNWIKTNTANTYHLSYDRSYLHSNKPLFAPIANIAKFQGENILHFNSGILCFHPHMVKLSTIEIYLKYLYQKSLIDTWFSEQITIGLAITTWYSARHNNVIALNPSRYFVYYSQKEPAPSDRVCTHFHGKNKTQMEYAGIIWLLSKVGCWMF